MVICEYEGENKERDECKCGGLVRVLMYPKGSIESIEDLEQIQFEILYPDGNIVSLKPRKIE